MTPWPLVALLSGCMSAPPPATPEFSDALRYTFARFEGEEADLAFAVRALEDAVYTSVDLTASSASDRALSPEHLTEADVEGLPYPGLPLDAALPIALAVVSPHPVEEHARIPLLADQTPVEPLSPEHYERTFLEGEACWGTGACASLRTDNELTKQNLLMRVTHRMPVNFRWVNLALPDPGDPASAAEPRMAYLARAWLPETAVGDGGDVTLDQFFTVEVWIPRDGRGTQLDEGMDSRGGGLLRVLSLWSQTSFSGLSFTDDQVSATTRAGMDSTFRAADRWIEAQR
ncbi:MAG: hypothetical protein JXX28_13025 [Deltaproteobacteria bacterium]|nr:hypothetical protein [Deltaproteobacteria bacterium]